MNKISHTYWAYRNKVTNKLWGVVHMPAQNKIETSKKKGAVLISYITEPFTLAPWEPFSNLHTMYWECNEIARLFSERGYEVDIIDSKNTIFIPKKSYAVCVDVDKNLRRLSRLLSKDCKKVFHILISHWEDYNAAEKNRLDQLEKRRGVRLAPRRRMSSTENAEVADFLEGFGNKAIFDTFAKFKKPIFFIPISAVVQFDFPEKKDWGNARKHFLWVGGGGAVLKGLDMALEAFATMPDLHLHACGPVYAEKDFVEAYRKELEETPNIHVYGRIDVGGKEFADIVAKCSALVYPSGGEGSSGAVVQAMHAGLVPIITHEAGIQEDSGYIVLENPSPASIAKAVRDFSDMPTERIQSKAYSIWKYAKDHYTRETFSTEYARFIDEILQLK